MSFVIETKQEKAVLRAELLRRHYDEMALRAGEFAQKNHFYHSEILRYHRFLIPKGSSILELGCGTGDLIGKLSPSYGVGVDVSPRMLEIAKGKYPGIDFVCDDIEEFTARRTFDYIIISGTLGSCGNIQLLLQKLSKMATADTRIIVSYYNELWGAVLRYGEKIGQKMPETILNWLSIDDIENFLDISGYQVIRRDFLMLLPKYIPILAPVLNKVLAKIPVIRRLALNQCVVARYVCPPRNAADLSASVIVTCRDEEGNIEGLVESIPQMGKHTEIIFVEGHSKDKTVEKIKEMIQKYPEKDIKLLKQKGIGQADAFRMGFDHAQGDLLCWLEADLTIPPQEVALFWDAYISGKGDYMNGTRFIYKMEKDAMPFFNFIGNRFFGNIFTLLLGQRFTDTLCGFKAISKKNYVKMREQIDYFSVFDPFGDFQLIFGVIQNALKVVEIPVHYQPRIYGQSKAYGQTFGSFLRHAWLLLKMSWIAFKKFQLSR